MNADRKQAEELKIKNTGSKEFPYYEIIRNNMHLCATNSIENAEEIVKAMQPLSPLPEITEEEIDEWIDKYAFRVPYNGSDNFYDDVAIKHCNAMKKWILPRLSERKEQKTTNSVDQDFEDKLHEIYGLNQQKGAPFDEDKTTIVNDLAERLSSEQKDILDDIQAAINKMDIRDLLY